MIFLILALVVAQTITGFDQLPDDAMIEVISRITDMPACIRLAATCHRLRSQSRLPLLLSSIFYRFSPIQDLCIQVRALIDLLRDHHRNLTRLITPQDATALYDRLVASFDLTIDTKAELIRSLTDTVPAFRAIVLAPIWDQCPASAILPDHLPIESVSGVPDVILTAIANHVRTLHDDDDSEDIRAIRRRYPPPFNQVYPYQRQVAERLLWLFPSYSHPLADPEVVLALQRYGIRFSFFRFLDEVEFSSDLIPALVPLLEFPYSPLRSLVLTTALCYQFPDHARALYDIVQYRAEIQADPPGFISFLNGLSDPIDLIRVLVQVPFMQSMVNIADDRGHTLLYSSIDRKQPVIARLLLTIPNIDLYRRYSQNETIFDHIFIPDPAEAVLRIRTFSDLISGPELTRCILSDIPGFISCLDPLFELNQVHNFRYMIQCDFFREILDIRRYRSELLFIAKNSNMETYQLLISCPTKHHHCCLPCTIQ